MLRKIIKHPWAVVAVCVLLTAFFGYQLRNVKIENTVRLYMPHSSSSYDTMLKTEDEFGSMIGLGISLETTGDTIITPEYYSVIEKITEQIEVVDFVESIDSLTSIDYIYGKDGSLIAGKLADDDYTGSAEDMETIRQHLIDWQEMYNRVIVTDDGKTTQIMITLQPKGEDGKAISADQQTKTLHEIKKICEEAIAGTDLEARYFGDPVLTDDAHDYMMHDLFVLIPFVAIIVLLSLYFSFHSTAGTLLPLITVLVSTVWSCGIMALMGFTFTIVASVIPVCLIACGSAYGIHVITHYYAAVKEINGELTKENHLDAIMAGLKDVMIAVILAAVTTIAGFISNVTSPIEPLRTFSVFSAAGVAFSLLLSITLIPALLYLAPLSKVQKHKEKVSGGLSAKAKAKIQRELRRLGGKTAEEANGSTLYSLYHFFAGTKARLIVFTLVIVLLSWAGIKHLVADTALVNYFPMDSKFRTDISYVDKNLAGTNSLYFVIRGNEKPASEVLADTDSDFGDFDFSGSETTSSDTGDFDFGDSDGFDFGGDTSSEPQKEYYSLTNPEILKAVDDLQNYLIKNHSGIGKVVSFTTFIKRMNQVMHVPPTDGSVPEATLSSKENYVDPNVQNAKTLSSRISVAQGLDILYKAYSLAGGKTASVEQVVTELQKQLNYNGLDYYEIPYDTEKYPAATREELSDLVTQYLYLLSSDSITKFSNNMTSPTAIRTQVQLRTHSTIDTGKIIADAKDYAAKHFPEGYSIEATGNGEMEFTMTRMVLTSQLTSIAISIALVFIIIALSFKSPLAGLIGAIPLALTIALNFMVMGFADIKLDLVTSIIASVAIGVGIDYTIHFMETYQQKRAKSDDLEEVTKETFKTSGKGIITNALAVGLGFLVLLFSRFIILRYIGVLVAIVMFTSSSLAMTIIPGMLNAIDPKFMWSKEEKDAYKASVENENK